MPGYDKNRFIKDSDEELDQFCCGICLEVLNNPVVTDCCRQTYCCDCITQWLSRENTCPKDKKPLTGNDLSPPPGAFINSINKMLIRCDYYLSGCQSVVLLSELAKHSTDCEFNPIINLINRLEISCDYESNNCQSVVLLPELVTHSTDCDFNANKKCKNCEIKWTSDHNCIEYLNSRVKTLTKVNENNNQRINELITENEAKLKDIVQRKDYEYSKYENLQELYYDICEDCADLRNEVEILTKDNQAKTKIITKLRKDVTILNKKLSANNVKILTKDNQAKTESITKLENNVTILNKTLADNNVKMNEQDKIINSLTSEIQELKNKIVSLQTTHPGINEALCKNINMLNYNYYFILKAAIVNINNQPNNHKLVDKSKPIPPRLYNYIISVIKDGLFKKDNFQDLAEYISNTLSGDNDEEEEDDSDDDETEWTVIVKKDNHDKFGIFYRYDEYAIDINFGDLTFTLFDKQN